MRSLFVLFLAAAAAYAADITGVWRYDGMPDSSVIICQDGTKVVLAAQHPHEGKSSAVIFSGNGTIDGTKISVDLKMVRRPNANYGGTKGMTHEDLVLSADGTMITGSWSNDLGQGVAAVLRRVN
jgi:hypothetical protein